MNKPIIIIPAVILALLFAIAGGYYLYPGQQSPAGPKIVKNPYVKPQTPLLGAIRPDFELPDVSGKIRHVQEWDGRVLVINFWATWCRPCLTEIPAFIRLQDTYGEQGLQFVGIALHTADEIKEYIAKVGMNYPSLTGNDPVINVAKSLGNRFIVLPYTVIIDRDRRIYFIRSGPLHYEEAEALIRSIL